MKGLVSLIVFFRLYREYTYCDCGADARFWSHRRARRWLERHALKHSKEES